MPIVLMILAFLCVALWAPAFRGALDRPKSSYAWVFRAIAEFC
jgi:hypothetical protein